MTPAAGGSLLQMLFGLALVLAAIAASAWLARRLGAGSAHGARLMKVVSALPVGAKERVVVVEIEGQWMVLGVAPGRVSALATLPRGELPQATVAQGLTQGFDFSALLNRARNKSAPER